MSTNTDTEKQARYLAKENRESDPEITNIYWFPDDGEVRLVEIHKSIPPNEDGRIHPYYFRPSPKYGLPLPSGVALIRPSEYGRIDLPESWGQWDQAVELVELEDNQ